MAEGTISGSFIETGIKGTNNEWTYFRIGDRVIAFIYKQLSAVINTATGAGNVYRSGEITVTQIPSFMTIQHICGMPADGSQGGNIRLHRVNMNNTTGVIWAMLYSELSSSTAASYPIVVIAYGTWNGT